MSIKQAFLQCALSNRAFYLLILALKERKIITVAPDSKDRRVKLIRLEPQARHVRGGRDAPEHEAVAVAEDPRQPRRGRDSPVRARVLGEPPDVLGERAGAH